MLDLLEGRGVERRKVDLIAEINIIVNFKKII